MIVIWPDGIHASNAALDFCNEKFDEARALIGLEWKKLQPLLPIMERFLEKKGIDENFKYHIRGDTANNDELILWNADVRALVGNSDFSRELEITYIEFSNRSIGTQINPNIQDYIINQLVYPPSLKGTFITVTLARAEMNEDDDILRLESETTIKRNIKNHTYRLISTKNIPGDVTIYIPTRKIENVNLISTLVRLADNPKAFSLDLLRKILLNDEIHKNIGFEMNPQHEFDSDIKPALCYPPRSSIPARRIGTTGESNVEIWMKHDKVSRVDGPAIISNKGMIIAKDGFISHSKPIKKYYFDGIEYESKEAHEAHLISMHQKGQIKGSEIAGVLASNIISGDIFDT